ncbi:MAG TPA: XRE family transcriptional regulator [Gemmataceae bacterium]|jgi:transcriptional regulator with XRE-family HTH domain|nr:XRE family transcriptional regulator [Gemmataceae bacterium]
MDKRRRRPFEDILDQERGAAEMMSRVPAAVLGLRLRRARTRQGLSIRDVASRASLSKTSVVRLEQGHRAYPLTVIKVCAALGLHLAGIVDPKTSSAAPVAVHHEEDDRWYDMTDFGAGPLGGLERPLTPAERKRFAENGAAVALLLLKSRLGAGRLLPTVLELYRASPPRSHAGEEFVYVLRGKAKLCIGGTVHTLAEGEAITFWSEEEHSYAPAGDSRTIPVRLLSLRIDEKRTRSPRRARKSQ